MWRSGNFGSITAVLTLCSSNNRKPGRPLQEHRPEGLVQEMFVEQIHHQAVEGQVGAPELPHLAQRRAPWPGTGSTSGGPCRLLRQSVGGAGLAGLWTWPAQDEPLLQGMASPAYRCASGLGAAGGQALLCQSQLGFVLSEVTQMVVQCRELLQINLPSGSVMAELMVQVTSSPVLASKCHTGCLFAVTCFSQQPLSSVRDSMGTIKHYKLLVNVAYVAVRPETQREWAPSPGRPEPGCFRKASKSVLKPIASSSHKTLYLRTGREQVTAYSVGPFTGSLLPQDCWTLLSL